MVGVRHKFCEPAVTSPVSTEVLRRISVLYAVKDECAARQCPKGKRCAERSRIILDDRRGFLAARLCQVSAKSKLAEAIRYALSRWDGLSRFLEDGRVDLDPNTVERSITPIAVNRMKAVFAGSDEGADNWVVIATLIENCKLSGIAPHDW